MIVNKTMISKKPKIRIQFGKGYKFVDNDPHWIESTIEGKYKWQK